ncbi:MAG: alpha/beta fold hydrolase [Bacteriovoracaceae bacterium]
MFKNNNPNFFKTSDEEQIFYIKNFTKVDHNRPVLIFNYGLVCSSLHWQYQTAYFDKHGFQILIHDYRGHFQSSGIHDVKKITFPQMAKDIKDLCEYLDINKAILLGHSMGVNVCLQMAKDFPDFIKAMVLISGTFMSVKDVMFDSNITEFITPFLYNSMEKYPEVMKKIWSTGGSNPLAKFIIHTTGFNKNKVSKEFVEIYLNRVGQLGPELFFQLFSEMTKQNIAASLDQMKMPILVMGGYKDQVIPNHMQRTLASLLENSETYFLKDGSHVPQADFPDLINERIHFFIEKNL